MNKANMYEDQLIQHDLVLRLLRSKWKWSNTKIILFIAILTAFLFFVVGSFASWSYTGTGKRIATPSILLFLVLWLILFMPLIWGAYLWQAQTAPSLVRKLLRDGVFGKLKDKSHEDVVNSTQKLLTSMSRPIIYFATVLALIGFWVVELTVSWPEQFKRASEYWFEVQWYLPIHIFAWTITLYALFLFVLRQVIFIGGLGIIFRKADVAVKPLHPDECGGLGAIGDYVKSSIWFAIGLGFIAVLFSLMLQLNGSDLLRRPDAIGLFVLYIVLAPFCLLVPILSSRSAMLRSRQTFLVPVAREFQEVLALVQTDIPDETANIKALNERLEQLQQYRETILKTYPVFPMSLGALRNFSITATIPFFSGAISTVLQLLLPKQP